LDNKGTTSLPKSAVVISFVINAMEKFRNSKGFTAMTSINLNHKAKTNKLL